LATTNAHVSEILPQQHLRRDGCAYALPRYASTGIMPDNGLEWVPSQSNELTRSMTIEFLGNDRAAFQIMRSTGLAALATTTSTYTLTQDGGYSPIVINRIAGVGIGGTATRRAAHISTNI
jgi:hypothetical protein